MSELYDHAAAVLAAFESIYVMAKDPLPGSRQACLDVAESAHDDHAMPLEAGFASLIEERAALRAERDVLRAMLLRVTDALDAVLGTDSDDPTCDEKWDAAENACETARELLDGKLTVMPEGSPQ